MGPSCHVDRCPKQRVRDQRVVGHFLFFGPPIPRCCCLFVFSPLLFSFWGETPLLGKGAVTVAASVVPMGLHSGGQAVDPRTFFHDTSKG